MDERTEQLDLLDRAAEQLTALLGSVAGQESAPTPCRDWTVAELADHVVSSTRGMATMIGGGEVDWTAPTPHVEAADLPAAFAEQAAALREALGRAPADAPVGPAWTLAELGCHTWDLATALDRPTGDLDQGVAEQGLGFMRASLTDDQRGAAFDAEQPAPEGADAYQRLAAFAGRRVG